MRTQPEPVPCGLDDRVPGARGGRSVLARAPLRVSLAGGGTDLPGYATAHGGEVISFAMDRYVGVTVYPRSFDGSVRACWEEPEQVPSAAELANRCAAAVLRRAGIDSSVQLASFADAPSGTGLGGSGAFTVALLHALRYGGDRLDRLDRRVLAEEAAAVEMLDLNRPVGKQDHYLAAFGGAQLLRIGRDLTVEREELAFAPEVAAYLRDDLLLFYTGVTRDAGRVLAAQEERTSHGDSRTLDLLRSIHTLVADMRTALERRATGDIGPILHQHWLNKARLSAHVSSPRVEELYRRAKVAGADGGKLLGAGGGGFLLVSCRPGRADEVREAMRVAQARELAFGLDHGGSQAVEVPL